MPFHKAESICSICTASPLDTLHCYPQPLGMCWVLPDILAQDLLLEMGASTLDSSHGAPELAALQCSSSLPKEQASLSFPARELKGTC